MTLTKNLQASLIVLGLLVGCSDPKKNGQPGSADSVAVTRDTVALKDVPSEIGADSIGMVLEPFAKEWLLVLNTHGAFTIIQPCEGVPEQVKIYPQDGGYVLEHAMVTYKSVYKIVKASRREEPFADEVEVYYDLIISDGSENRTVTVNTGTGKEEEPALWTGIASDSYRGLYIPKKLEKNFKTAKEEPCPESSEQKQ